MTYKSADGRLRTIWCVEIDGVSSYETKPPDLDELARHYQLVLYPEFV